MICKKLLVTIVLSLAGFIYVYGQIGLIFDEISDEAYRSLPLYPTETRGIATKVSLVDYCPSVPSDQGVISSCVGHAIAHAITIRRAYQCKITNKNQIDKMLHSASYIYNQIKLEGDCKSGARLPDGLELVKNQGVCLASTFQNSQFSCKKLPNKSHEEEAAYYVVKNIEKIFDLNEDCEKKIQYTLNALSNNNPVVIGLIISEDFKNIPLGTSSWNPLEPLSNELGHALVVVDYDIVNKEFVLINSYGKKWGKNGFINISKDRYCKYVRYACVMTLGRMKCD